MTESKQPTTNDQQPTTQEEEQVNTAYEVGYLLVPTVPEDHLDQEAAGLQAIIEKHGGVMRKADAPTSLTLAYEMEKKMKGKKQVFNTAFFGSMVFDASAGTIDAIKQDLEKGDNMLRLLIIKRSEKSLVAGASAPQRTYQKKTDEEKGKMDEGKVDSAIEELVAE